jgi:hypothetical protein
MEPWLIVVLTVVVLVVLKFLVLLIISRGSLARLGLAIRIFYRVLGDPGSVGRAQDVLTPPPPPPPPKRSGEALRLLALLQREGRLLDFFLEDISGATDQQIGEGVRELHRKASGVLKERLVLEPILPGEEGQQIEVPVGFDPSAIRLTGNVTGQPPFRGRLIHHGWRVRDFKLPTPSEGVDEFVVAQAEVELP